MIEYCNWCGMVDPTTSMIEVIDAKGDVMYFHKHCHKEYHEWFDKRNRR